MAYRRRNVLSRVARESFALGLAAPEVVTQRVLRLWLAGDRPSRHDRAEVYRMSAEKVTAFWESWNAMLLETFRANVRFASTWMAAPWSVTRSTVLAPHRSKHAQRAAAAVVAAGLAPVRRRAVANAKRLRRRRR